MVNPKKPQKDSRTIETREKKKKPQRKVGKQHKINKTNTILIPRNLKNNRKGKERKTKKLLGTKKQKS